MSASAASATAAPASPGIQDAAKTYLRYTDKKGHTVVLSLDKDGLPIFKTTFMTRSEASRLNR